MGLQFQFVGTKVSLNQISVAQCPDTTFLKGTEYPISNKEYQMSKERKYYLQERLIDYAVQVVLPLEIGFECGILDVDNGESSSFVVTPRGLNVNELKDKSF